MHLLAALLLLLVIKYGLSMQERICGTIEVRNFKDINLLENCTVVFGNVVLAFPTVEEVNYTEAEINSLSFPLREVTGFMFLYSLTHLDSTGKLFPNLTLIRGQRLFSNYALVLYETDLKEMTFRNLLKINRGSVRIGGSNDKMCLPKIDWDSIIMNGRFLAGKNITRLDCTSQFERCSSCKIKNACWGPSACQRFDQRAVVEGSKNIPCHPLCLGRCVNSTSAGCHVCRDMSELGDCVYSCSHSRYLHVETRRCITAEECVALGRKMHNKECVQHCPKGYMAKINDTDMDIIDYHCTPCVDNKCLRVCSNLPEIKTIAQLEAIGVGCTIINGSLEISIADDINNLTAELQIYLGDVEEIHGSLKIHRSTPLTSLTFLNKLRVVYGTNKQENIASVRIFENQNLQSLFDWRLRENMQLEIKHGLVYIFDNPMLCESEIEKFNKSLVSYEKRQNDLISRNGYQSACKTNDIKTYARVLSYKDVEISWDDLVLRQMDNVTRYLLQYVAIEGSEIKEADENMLFERDSCTTSGWKSVILQEDNITTTKSNYSNFAYIISDLTQFTHYAFVIKRYNSDSSNSSGADDFKNQLISGISEINTFQTLMNIPKRVINFSTLIKSTNTITLKWDVFEREKKAIGKFLLYIYEKPPLLEQLDARNYCANPINYDDMPVIQDDFEDSSKYFYNTDKCCEKCCNEEQAEKKKKVEGDDFKEMLIKHSQAHLRPNAEAKRIEMEKLPGFINKVPLEANNMRYTATNLTAFTTYVFHIYTCAEKCSDYEILTERTVFDETFDSIILTPINHDFYNNEIKLKFDEPKETNGAILSYTIEIQKVHGSSMNPFLVECITRKQHEENGFEFTLTRVEEGSYIYRVKANSLAQKGRFTDWHNFRVIIQPKELPIGLIIIGTSILLTLICVAIVSYYYKHKISILIRKQNDTAFLVNEMEQTDFRTRLENRNCFDQLSDIAELDDE